MTSIMATEAASTADLLAQQLRLNQNTCERIAQRIQQLNPSVVYIVARGSSDHAGVFAKYLIEVELGIPVVAAAPSVVTVFHKQLKLNNALVIGISQSGRSPDILQHMQMAKEAGALCIGLVNDETSPLANLVDELIPLRVEQELAVAATKSYLACLSALLQLVAYSKKDRALIAAIQGIPDALKRAVDGPKQLNADMFNGCDKCIVLGRGFGYAIAKEVALKLKEVCAIQAEAFSSAEFVHGPVALAQKPLKVLSLGLFDESQATHQQQVDDVTERGAHVLNMKVFPDNVHPRLGALMVMQRFYLDIADISVQLGCNPDTPQGLNKVTMTV
ncbi:SIS domain-containing protein [Paraglaciecola chathamensis]|uniref:glucosamine-6-phosphate deaminase NagB-II n=1 Tax=Paraglaciecola chathamensis TaxID=368405 RepID=UPI0026FFFED6|nr:SIS domain-containing protein [Paraglaciecola chathamensis]MDO6840344.1 SIS domain-containing protein [Paraglaciecola chathamensis]